MLHFVVFIKTNHYNAKFFDFASVAELVDALDLGSSGVARESSSLSARTILLLLMGSDPYRSTVKGREKL